MIKKIKAWWMHRYHPEREPLPEYKFNSTYTHEQLERAYELGYNDGRRDGLAIARQQATKSLKEILWEQNQKKK